MKAIIESKLTNESPDWIVIGNYNTVIAVYRSEAEADDYVDDYDVDSSPYACIFAVGPGMTIAGRL